MVIRLTIILLVCATGCTLAQYSDGDAPTKATNSPRRFKPHTPRITPTAQSIFANQRFRKPVPIKSRAGSSAEIKAEGPVYIPDGGGRSYRPQALPLIKPTVQSDSEENSSLIQPNSEIKPVNEENEKDDDVVQVLSNLGAVSSFPSSTSNLITPAPQPSPVQYRPLPAISVTRPTPTPDQNIPPVQYRPHKQNSQRPREDASEGRSSYDQPSIQFRTKQVKVQKFTEEIPESRSSYDQPSIQFRSKPSKPQKPIEEIPESRSSYDQPSFQFRSKPSKPQKPIEEIPEARSSYDQPSIQFRSKPVKQSKYIDESLESRPLHKQRQPIPPKKISAETDYYTSRSKKPVAQVIRRYREETEDGSIVWGYENDDGSYKEEVMGIDCITRGKYGYVDPDGVRHDYTYETGIKCDEEEQQEDILNTFVDYQENKLVLPSGKTIDLSSMGKKTKSSTTVCLQKLKSTYWHFYN